MPNFIPKKDRRFPIGALFLIMYIIIGYIGATLNSLVNAWSRGYTIPITVLVTVLLGGIYLLGQIMFIAIIVMLFAKVRHSTYAMPGAVGLGVHVLGFLSSVLLSIINLVKLFKLIGMAGTGSLIVSFVRSIASNGSTLVGALLGMIGWICFILLAVFSTKRSAKKVNWTLIFAFGACLIFASAIIANIISSFITLINVVLTITTPGFGGMPTGGVIGDIIIRNLITVLTAGISIVAEVFGLVGMLLAGIWLVKPAKRGYVPAAPAEEKAEDVTVKEEGADAEEKAEDVTVKDEAADAEDQENTKAKHERINTLVDFYNA